MVRTSLPRKLICLICRFSVCPAAAGNYRPPARARLGALHHSSRRGVASYADRISPRGGAAWGQRSWAVAHEDERRARIVAAVTGGDATTRVDELMRRLSLFAVTELAASGCTLALIAGAELLGTLADAGRHFERDHKLVV
jgi:hypothetical protein